MNLLNKSSLNSIAAILVLAVSEEGSMKNPLMKPVNHIERKKFPCKIRSNTITNH